MSLTGTSTPATTSLDAVVFGTLREAAAALCARQRKDGSWQCDTDIGPIGLATQLITERLLGAADPDEVLPALRYFARRQRDDGSFPPYPGATHGSVTVTALCEAALVAVGISAGHAVVERARGYVDAHGGEAAIVEAFRSRGDPAALYLVAAGRIDGGFLPRLPPGIALAAHGRVLRSRVHAGNVMTMLVLAALAERVRSVSGLLASARRAATGLGIPEYLCRWQNADGSWNGSPLQTTLMLVGLHAAGMTARDRPVSRALA